MPDTIHPDDTRHRSRAELEAALDHILASPKDDGPLEMIVIRPAPGERRVVETAQVSLARGVHDETAGDHWEQKCWQSLPDGSPHPDVQICMMNARCIEAIAGPKGNWAPAGDNLFLDLDLTPANMPPGTRFALGSAEFVVTEVPHKGCGSFIERYGRDACVFVNFGGDGDLKLRGIYARVTKDGQIAVGDRVRKLG